MSDAISPQVPSGAAGLRVAYLGNFQPGFEPHPWHPTRWSTETHVALSLESLGCTVERLQEGEVRAVDLAERVQEAGADLFMWTCTYGLAVTGGTDEERREAIRALRDAGVPSLSFHLDKWWDVADGRATRIPTDAFFRTDLVATADEGGGRWQAEGINAVYSPPAIYHAEAITGTPRVEFQAPIAFVGSWRGSYHPEWTHRADLVNHLQTRWPHTAFWPRGQQIRGQALSDLYASVKVVVGDSFAPPGSTHISDRTPETLGRGGFLLHPRIGGIEEDYADGVHLRLWMLGDWDEFDRLITYYLDPAHDDERRQIAARGQAHVLANHTYARRLEWVVPMALAAHAAKRQAMVS